MKEPTGTISSMPFRDVGCHRSGRATNLTGHSIQLVPREGSSGVVALKSQIHCQLPNLQILVGIDQQWRPLFAIATPYSLLSLLRLFIPRQHVFRPLPWREEIEGTELLPEVDGLVDDAFGFVVVTDLDETGEREILAQRMALEAGVGEDATQVRVSGEEHAVKIVDLALVPVVRREHVDHRRNGRLLVRRDLHADALVLTRRQQMVHHLEPLLARGIIGTRDVDEGEELTLSVALQEGQ